MNIYFILWAVLFPISCSVCSYIDAKTALLKGEKLDYSDGVKAASSATILFAWSFVGYCLYYGI